VNGPFEYLHKDQLGSVKLITAADGSLVKTSAYKVAEADIDWTSADT
jgi:hypothetical protein